MRKIFIGDDTERKEEQNPFDGPPESFDDLQQMASQFEVYTTIERKTRSLAVVKVLENSGTSMMLASAHEDLFWLRQHAEKYEKVGGTTLYYFRF